MRQQFKAGVVQKDLINSIQNELRQKEHAVHVRIFGEQGAGKTRLALEATGAEDLSPLVIYVDSAARFLDSYLMNEIIKDDNDFSAILVVDECDRDNRFYIWNKFKHLGSRIKLVSIYNEHDGPSGDIHYFDTPVLEEEQISEILQEYGLTKDQAYRWVELCSGSPRVAQVIGWNLKNNPDDAL